MQFLLPNHQGAYGPAELIGFAKTQENTGPWFKSGSPRLFGQKFFGGGTT